MRTGCVRESLGVLGLTLLCVNAASAYESPRPGFSVFNAPIAAVSSLYELSDPLPLSTSRWDPLYGSRLDLSTGLVPRHEVRFSALATRAGWGPDTNLLGMDYGWNADPLRATYRYTFLEQEDWAWKVGITTRVNDPDPVRSAALGIDRARFGGLPQVHFAGEGKLSKNWLLTFDADGLMTPHGRALDLGVRVDYALSRSFFLFGGYRMSDHYVEGDETSLGLTNTANVGVRYRF